VGRRLAYLGTPEVAVAPLRALHAAGHDVAIAVTQPDRRRGRGGATSPSPVKAAALELDIPVTDRVDDVIDAGVELGVVVAFGRLIRPYVLAAVPMINMHFSLLPRWRGAAPVERAMLAGDAVTGVCIMDVTDELDAGDVYASAQVPIGDTTTADQLRARLVEVGTELLLDLVAGPLPAGQPQVGEVTYAQKLRAEEWELDWTDPAVTLHRWVRAGHAWTTFRGRRMRVLEAQLGQLGDRSAPAAGAGELVDGRGGLVASGVGTLRLTAVQPEGRAPMPWREFANGAHPRDGERLG
jgi:methionyl-tRNA formyltransferase